MIQVLLLILKIIGIAILSVLGLILLVLALVLFVPVFYRIRVIHNPEKTQVKARISFLFPLLLVTVQYLKKLSYKLRIFGIVLLDSDKPKKVKNKKEKKPKNKKKRKEKDQVTPEPVPETVAVAEPSASVEAEAIEQEASEPSATEQVSENSKPEQEQKKEKKNILEEIKGKIQKIRETISNIIKKIKKLLHQKEEVQRILAKPETKQALKFAWDKLKRLLKHVLPRKIKGYVAYGADNPATTGQVLGILSIVYAKTGQLLSIRPNFEEKQLECDVEVKGHIQVFTLLVIAIKVFFNKELRETIAEFKNLKEVEE